MKPVLARLIPIAMIILAAASGFVLGLRWSAGKETALPAESGPKQLWTCGMHPQVIQDKPGICPICEMKLTPIRQAPETTSKKGDRKIKYWWDPMMSPPYISDKPGKSPMGMDLVPVYEDELSAGHTVTIDPVIVQNMGIRTAPVEHGPLQSKIRAVGYFREAEPNRHDISLKIGGWIEKLHADVEGAYVKKGAPLFELYSPELLVAQEELIAAARSMKRLGAEGEDLVRNARRKLQLWNLSDEEIDAVAQSEKARPTLIFRSPVSGHVVEKPIVQGSAVQPGERLLRIVDHSILWLDAQIFEYQLPLVSVGQEATAVVRAFPGKTFSGKIVFIHPHVDEVSRTVSTRLEFSNPDFDLRPGMYASVELVVHVADHALTVPREAVIDTGVRQIAFVAADGGRFSPRQVQMGVETDDGRVQILKGLAPGELVVTSGQFLLDVESRTQEAIQKMLQPERRHDHSQALPRESNPLVRSYLDLGKMLAMDHAADPGAMIQAAAGLPELREPAQAMKGAPLEEQRKHFKTLSDRMIRHLEGQPDSPKLYVIHCSMYPGSWLQADKEIVNPYYGASMLRCGEIARRLHD